MARSRKKSLSSAGGEVAGPARMSERGRNIRETVESIVIAFVLAFLFRTFEAEAFVIPTGSMAPTLRGQHKDLICRKCGFRYQASASIEADEESGGFFSQGDPHGLSVAQDRFTPDLHGPSRIMPRDGARPHVTSATCPMCRFSMAVDDLPTYNGDRILVNKFAYEWSDPARWDVVVFKYPGDAKMNYIKRVVGLPNETVLIRHGDLFIKKGTGEQQYAIARKPPGKVLAMMQIVHDDRYDPTYLVDRNWPRRWQVWPPAGAADTGWTHRDAGNGGADARQVFVHKGPAGAENQAAAKGAEGGRPATHWIRYQHLVPSWRDWQRIRSGPMSSDAAASIRPKLITDFYGYNTWMLGEPGGEPHASKLGLHWVGDLVVQCQARLQNNRGQLVLDLVRAGKHHRCSFDLATGKARLAIDGVESFAPTASTPVRGPGRYRLTFANVDQQLFLWVDGSLIAFDAATTYDAQQVRGDPKQDVPRSDESDRGDLAPVGIGAQGAAVEIAELRVLRDIYYIADDAGGFDEPITDYDLRRYPVVSLSRQWSMDFLADPKRWQPFGDRQEVRFSLADNQYFVLGDNSPFSKDGRLWEKEHYGHYVERQLLIGKALFIYWPHSWNRIPGTRIPFPLFPSIQDMGLVR